MNTLREKFHVFIRSSFQDKRREELFEHIWHAYGRRIRYYIAQLIPFRHPAFEDVFQEIMLKIFRHLPDFNPARSFKAWVYTIVRHHCLDFLKNRQERLFAEKAEAGPEVPGTDDPEKAVLSGQAMARIEGFIRTLDPADREIAYLRFYENLRYREIGRILDKNPGTLRAKVHHWKKDLAEELRGFV